MFSQGDEKRLQGGMYLPIFPDRTDSTKTFFVV